jgi:hypothetical protein
VVDSLDLLLYTSRLMPRNSLAPLQRSVATAVIGRLAGWDPAVSEVLVGQPLQALVEPIPILADLARQRGWDRAEALGIDRNGVPGGWHLGLSAHVDGRPLLHSALLALDDPRRELTRRIWSAQVGVFFPLVEERRQHYLHELRHVLRVPFTSANGMEIHDLLDLEIGHIEWQLVLAGRPR